MSNEATFTVETDGFLGPIDLLLHLVKSNELEIEKVSLAYVADQYVSCLEKMKEMDLEVVGEYLVIAATLLSIKSSILLAEPVELEIDEDGNVLDPHEELLMRLREAAVYRDGAELLGNRPMLGLDVFSPKSVLSKFPDPEESYKEHDPYLLGIAFKKLLDKTEGDEEKYEVMLESVSIVDRMMEVIEVLKVSKDGCTFEKLVGKTQTRPIIVGTFIALLELCKRQILTIRQEDGEEGEGGEILVGLREHEEFALDDIQSEFDTDSDVRQNGQIAPQVTEGPQIANL